MSLTNKTDKIAVVLGASRRKERYSYKALKQLQIAGYPVIPVNPAYKDIEGIPCAANLAEAVEAAGSIGIHTLTLYIGPRNLESYKEEILETSPARVIFNPGTESPMLQSELDTAGIPWKNACTLVLLSTDQY